MAFAAYRHVLVVDDDDKLRNFLIEVLTQRGYRVTGAATGEEALAAARQKRPDLVLLDVNLPGTSGYDVCRQFRSDFGAQVPILFMSGVRTESFDQVAGLRLGGDDYIVKPFAPDELLARVDRFIERTVPDVEPAAAPAANSRLTRRELQVLQLLADGRTPKEIGLELSVTRKTIATHIQNILVKLEVHNQAQAVGAAFRMGLVELPVTARRK